MMLLRDIRFHRKTVAFLSPLAWLTVPLIGSFLSAQCTCLLFLSRIAYNIDSNSNTVWTTHKFGREKIEYEIECISFKWYQLKSYVLKIHWHGTQVCCGPFHPLSIPADSFPSKVMWMASHLKRSDTCLSCYHCWISQLSRQYCVPLTVHRCDRHGIPHIYKKRTGNYSNNNHYAVYTVNKLASVLIWFFVCMCVCSSQWVYCLLKCRNTKYNAIAPQM